MMAGMTKLAKTLDGSRENPAQSEARKKWEAFARKKPSALSVAGLAKAGFLHPKQCNAAALQGAFEGLKAGGASNGLLFMLHAHMLAGWVPLQKYSPASALLVAKKNALLAFAATEAASGSDIFRMETKARKTKTGWILNGKKTFITNATKAGFILLLARPEGAAHAQDFACFLLPANAKGLKRKKLKLMGLSSADVGELELKNVKLKDSHLVGGPRQGAEFFRMAMAWERSLILSSAPAALEKLTADLEKEALKKLRGGRPLAENLRFAGGLASVRAQAAEIRAQIAVAAFQLDCDANAFLLSARTKMQASILYEEASRTLLQLGGKEAFLAGSAIEENFRDSLASSLYSGPNDVLGALLEAAQ
jgi:alkylation response protein AidB-like acyl-CoA dehydrogenase